MNVKKLRSGKTRILTMVAALLTCSLLGACSDVGDASGAAETGNVKERGVQAGAEAQTRSRAEAQTNAGAEEAAADAKATDGNGLIDVIILPDDSAGEAESGAPAEGKGSDDAGIPGGNAGAEEDITTVSEENEILLVNRRTNFAWGHYDGGWFIDAQGGFYFFDFNDTYPGFGGEEDLSFIERLRIIRDHCESERFFGAEFVKQVQKLGEDLSAEDEFDQKHMMYDYGQDTLYFWQPKTQELLKCESHGDVEYTPKNESAQKIVKLFEDELERLASESGENNAEFSEGEYYLTPTVYSRTDSHVLELEVKKDVADLVAGNWIMTGPEQLKVFAEKSGIGVDSILEQIDENAQGNAIYFVQAEGPEEAAGHGKIEAFGIFGKRIDFTFEEKNGQTNGQNGLCRVVAVSKKKFTKDLTGFTDLEGNLWKYFGSH
ncbi:MAG: hypothetical protein J6Z33_10305 [Lachnospiraceae bacterium]|nr:hypothetical protein [Lachnospiraceae bacterium]